MLSSDNPRIGNWWRRFSPARVRADAHPYPASRSPPAPAPSPNSETPRWHPVAAQPDYVDMFERAPVGYMRLDEAGHIQTINLAAAAILGWDPAWLIGKPFSRWVATNDKPLLQAHQQRLRACGKCVRQALQVKNRHGRMVRVRLESVREAAGVDGATTVFRSMLIDISGEEQSARKLRRLQLEMAHLTRLRTAGELATSLAHELNQPLATVVLNCGAAMRLLNKGGERDADFAEALTQAAEAASFASEVIRHLRGFLRPGERMLQVCTVPNLVHDVCMLIEPDARDQDIALQLDIEPGLPSVCVDPVQIQQVLVNLARNSIEAMAADNGPGSIRINAHRQPPGQIRVSVEDTGPGLDALQLQRIFAPLYTTKQDGMGVGLSISRAIIEARGGQMWATGQPGHGASFHFTLPAYDEMNRDE